ncbi:hypothetical protein HYY69_05500 [Candidatus Woesearchaeota archaeon]|nr:hypothetical protein [Candidatus Woesearchaeota archaeon]
MISLFQALLLHKRGFVTSPIDLLKGLFIGFVVGLVLMFLLAKGVITWFDVCGTATNTLS